MYFKKVWKIKQCKVFIQVQEGHQDQSLSNRTQLTKLWHTEDGKSTASMCEMSTALREKED